MLRRYLITFSSGLGSAQIPLAREKLKAWKKTAGRRGKLPTLACGKMDGQNAVNQPRNLKRLGNTRHLLRLGLNGDLIIKLVQGINYFVHCVFL